MTSFALASVELEENCLMYVSVCGEWENENELNELNVGILVYIVVLYEYDHASPTPRSYWSNSTGTGRVSRLPVLPVTFQIYPVISLHKFRL